MISAGKIPELDFAMDQKFKVEHAWTDVAKNFEGKKKDKGRKHPIEYNNSQFRGRPARTQQISITKRIDKHEFVERTHQRLH